MSPILSSIASPLAELVGSGVAALLGLGIHLLMQKLAKKLDNQAASALLEQMDKFAEQSVNAAEQTVVDSLKDSGQWGTAASYERARMAAMMSLQKSASGFVPQLAAIGVTDLKSYFTTLVESKIKQIELSKVAPGPAPSALDDPKAAVKASPPPPQPPGTASIAIPIPEAKP